MRYYFSLLLMLGLLSQPLQVLAIEDPSTIYQPSEPQDFWPPAQQLVQKQIYLIAEIERAIVSPDPNQVRSVRGQLFLYTSSVDRLLKDYYQFPNILCAPTATATFDDLPAVGSLSAEQVRVYCFLYNSTQKLDSLRPVLDHRLVMLDGVGEFVSSRRDPILGIPIVRGDISVPPTPRLSPLPDLPPAEPTLIGRTGKNAIADYVPPFPPAIVPPVQVNTTLLTAKTLLAQAQRNFPRGTEFIVPDEVSLSDPNNPYALYRAEVEPYNQFLTIPNTGITRILNAEFYRQNRDKLRNRLLPTTAERFSFPPLFKPFDGFTPRLEIQIADNNFQIVQPELNYGFLVDLGDIPLENIDYSLTDVSVFTQQFFLTYQPPNELEPLQADRRRFITGKQQNFGLSESILTEAPAVLNHTYLVRTIQFQLPEILLNGDRISRSQRRNLNALLQTPSIDLLIAFRPVYRRQDGSYTVLWRVIKQFPDPQIQGLEKYIDLE
ncbi:hypothetical protein [Argonema galeatum]|uniref:hypothetical protein n=1 Tax=Argonema galeatum TaxID=2942762 RepID=UPI002011CAE8|nr:hypothetical protein [Argonema galeatum]MCL1466975.1 hypothetical protein [Argonema galeatum A003/A1]